MLDGERTDKVAECVILPGLLKGDLTDLQGQDVLNELGRFVDLEGSTMWLPACKIRQACLIEMRQHVMENNRKTPACGTAMMHAKGLRSGIAACRWQRTRQVYVI